MNLYLGIFLIFVGQIIGWFQLNAQYTSEWWKGRPIVAAFLLGVPCSIAFWYSWKLIVDETGSAWTARFMGSSGGMIIFPVLTWYFLGESMFTAKTMVCLTLAVAIMLIQLFW